MRLTTSHEHNVGLAYGAYPPKVAASAKLPLSEAEDIFDSYHNRLFPGITKYRNEHVLAKSKEQGYLHLGLGFRIYTDDPDGDIRTVANATCQFWSVLSILAINKLHQMIDEAGYQEDIIVTATIYDSIYFIVRDDVNIIKWLNDRIVPIMEQDFMENQTLHNSADLEIGPNWSELYHLDHNISTQEIKEVREKWH